MKNTKLLAILTAVQLLSGAALAQNSSLEGIRIDGGGHVHIAVKNAPDIALPPEKGQVGADSARLSEDKQAAGWLVLYSNCCTSYPIPLKLILYRVGKPLLRLGNGMLISDWHFVRGSKKVAFSTNTVHGDLAPQFELHEVKTGRLLARWDGHLDENSPKWTQGFSD